MNAKNLVILVSLVFSANTLAAAENGFYVGAGIGESEVNDLEDFGFNDNTDTAYKVYGGYEFNRWLAVEAGYIDLGRFTTTVPRNQGPIETRVEADGMTIGLRAQVTMSKNWFVQGQIGALFWDAEARISGGFFDGVVEREDGEDAYFGAGIGRNLGQSWRLSAEWTRFDFSDADVDYLGLGLNYRFGR